MRPPKTYPLTLSQVEMLADALTAADGHISCASEDKPLIEEGHAILEAALGIDAYLVYGLHDEESA